MNMNYSPSIKKKEFRHNKLYIKNYYHEVDL